MIVNRRHIVLLAVLLLSVNSYSQLLYEISGNGVAAKSYLFATNRLCQISFLDTVPNIFKIFSRCDKVITEMAMYDFETVNALKVAAVLPDSLSISEQYSEDENAAIDKALRANTGLGLDKLERMKPSYITELYRNELLSKWLGYDANTGSEVFFQTVAAQTGIPVYPLDDMGETLYMLFDKEPFHWQCKELLSIIEHPEREVKLEKSILEAYKMGQLTQIAYLIEAPDNLSTHSYSDYTVCCRRNAVWVKRLKPYLAEGKAFICLDAVCLGGEKGLLALLRAEGYKVKVVNK
ncbi:MAG TPA: hypothetical protein DIW30_04050 [Bacteroidales bacterium]|nr:hypothetical protein [Bacteroidales bacterium]